jgi:hypothetical protein
LFRRVGGTNREDVECIVVGICDWSTKNTDSAANAFSAVNEEQKSEDIPAAKVTVAQVVGVDEEVGTEKQKLKIMERERIENEGVLRRQREDAMTGSRKASKPGVVAVKDEEDTNEVLYGRDEDEKAKARSSRGKSFSKPGAERVSKSSRKPRAKSKGCVEDPLFDSQKNREKKSSSKPNVILVDDNGMPKQSSGTAAAMDSLGVIPTQGPIIEEMERDEKKTKGSSKQKDSQDSGFRKKNIIYIVIIVI